MEIYTNNDELPDDIAETGDDRIPVKDLPDELKQQLTEWGVDVEDQIRREEDGSA